MAQKQIEVTCPCCATRLVVDVLTQTVLKHAQPRQLDETGKEILDESRWDQARDKVKGRLDGGDDKFDSALSREKSRSRDLDELFKKAQDKLAGREPDAGGE
jgi:hypothetical protein